jgi:hypothetical protein
MEVEVIPMRGRYGCFIIASERCRDVVINVIDDAAVAIGTIKEGVLVPLTEEERNEALGMGLTVPAPETITTD